MTTKTITGQKWHCCDLAFEAEKPDRPFETKLTAVFAGPAGEQLQVPGFYNGNNEWIVRFTPLAEGNWSYTTSSDLSALNGKTGTVVCTKNENPDVHGRLMINKTNRRHFQYEDGLPYFLIANEIDWLFALDLDNSKDIPKTRMLVDAIAENGLNHVIMNVYAHEASWDKQGKGTEYDFSAPPLFPFGGTNDKPDHSTLNVEFFKRLDRVMEYLHQKGIVAHLMIYVWNKKVNWPEKGSRADDQYLDYVVARYQAYSNMVWDVSKEALSYNYAGDDYIRNRALRVREKDAYRHLITVHDGTYCEKHPDTIDFFSIQCWQSVLYSRMRELRNCYANMPVFNIEHGGYERGPYETFTGGYVDPVVCLARNYECAFSGTYSTYYWQCSAWDIVVYDIALLSEEDRPCLEFFRYMRDFFSGVDFSSLEPTQEYTTSGFCLFRENELYLFYKPEGTFSIHLCLPKEIKRCNLSWFDPVTGRTTDAVVCEGNVPPACRAPWGEDAAVLKIEVLDS